MSIFKAQVLTNCTEDPFWRVKLKAPGVWDESCLIPSINSIYLNAGDSVIVFMEEMNNPIILGRFLDYNQQSANPDNAAPPVFQAVKDGDWVVATASQGVLSIKTSKGYQVDVSLEGVSVKTKDVQITADEGVTIQCKNVQVSADDGATVNAQNVTIQGTDIKLDGKVQYTHGFGPPDGRGPLCGLPNCIFSGSPHGASETQ